MSRKKDAKKRPHLDYEQHPMNWSHPLPVDAQGYDANGYNPRLREQAYREFGVESGNLGASEIACAVADAWAAVPEGIKLLARKTGSWIPVAAALDRLEAATRGSARRKVRP